MVTTTADIIEGNEKIGHKIHSFIENIFNDILIQNETRPYASNHLLEKLSQVKNKFDLLRNDELNHLYANVFNALDRNEKLDDNFIKLQPSNHKQEAEMMNLVADIEIEMSKLNIHTKHSILQLIFICNVLFATPL